MQVACRTSVCHSCETGLISGSVIEYASDLAFRTPAILKPLYEQLSRQAILTILSPDPVEPPADGNLLICCSQPRGDIALDL